MHDDSDSLFDGLDLSALDNLVLEKMDKLKNPSERQSFSSDDTQAVVNELFTNDRGPQLEHLECLKKFGHENFRQKQWDIIHSVMTEKKDVMAVMSTGYGKSLCFQFPAFFTKRMVLVVCPLISLMEDQVLAMKKIGIPGISFVF